MLIGMTFNIYLVIFVVSALIVVAGGTYKLTNMEYSIAAFIFFICGSGLFVLYGLRWFASESSIFADSPVSWPPSINSCPDFLTYYDRTKPDGTVQKTCIDRIGVSRNGTLKSFPATGDAPASDDYYFSLTTTAADGEAKNNELCQRAISMGLTWEGITNGEGCTKQRRPAGSTSGSSAQPSCV
jgi:hypothetical protein